MKVLNAHTLNDADRDAIASFLEEQWGEFVDYFHQRGLSEDEARSEADRIFNELQP